MNDNTEFMPLHPQFSAVWEEAIDEAVTHADAAFNRRQAQARRLAKRVLERIDERRYTVGGEGEIEVAIWDFVRRDVAHEAARWLMQNRDLPAVAVTGRMGKWRFYIWQGGATEALPW